MVNLSGIVEMLGVDAVLEEHALKLFPCSDLRFLLQISGCEITLNTSKATQQITEVLLPHTDGRQYTVLSDVWFTLLTCVMQTCTMLDGYEQEWHFEFSIKTDTPWSTDREKARRNRPFRPLRVCGGALQPQKQSETSLRCDCP